MSAPGSQVDHNAERQPLPQWWVSYLLQTERRLFILSALAKILWSACALSCAFYFVRTLVATNDVDFGIGICVGYLAVSILLSISAQFLGLYSGQLGSRVKARLAALVAEHALLHAVTSQSSQALALTLSSSDAHLVYDGAMTFHNLWAAPVESIVIIGLLIFLSGDSGWIAAGICSVIVITMYTLSIIMTRIRGRFNAVQSKQVSLFFEVLQNMRPFRFYGWDAFFLDKLNKLTDEMAPLLVQLGIFKSLNLALVFACPPLMGIAIFGHYTVTNGRDLPANIAFPCLSLFNTLRFALVVLPNAVRAYSSASTAYNRIREFLGSEKAVDTRVMSETTGAVEIENLPVGPNKTILAKWKAQPGELWVFQGPVRSYKSTLIETIAGHYPIPSSASVRVGGRVSYAMQQPWMQQATIKDNIVCCEPWNEERYKQVIFACALTTDLSIMPLGDATPVAEKGISLSGGQRQRVALARAVYRIADIYLLDNPISALDDQTQEHVWTHLFEGLLQRATVIVGSSRPVISCTAVLHLSTDGVSESDSGIARFNGPVVASASATVPPRYSQPSPSFAASLSPVASGSITKPFDVSVQIAPPSPKIEPNTPATFRSRVGSLKMTIEEAAVDDVTKEVAAYAQYADMLEENESSLGSDALSSAKNSPSGRSAPLHSSAVAIEMLGVKSDPGSVSHSFRRRVPSFQQYLDNRLDLQMPPPPTSSGTIEAEPVPSSGSAVFRERTGGRSGSIADVTEVPSDVFRERTGSMRERTGSRRASFLDYVDNLNVFPASTVPSPSPQVAAEETIAGNSNQNDSSVFGPIYEHEDTAQSSSSGQLDAVSATPAAAESAARKSKHGLQLWAEAGSFRIYFLISAAYPIAQIIRIFSDIFVRFWTEKTYFSSQQANLEVYSELVAG
jgi:ABC-type multidrug transport system fused ATPase/permease subunit